MGRKALFLANDIGGGLGHVRRCVQIAKTLHGIGWQPAFVFHNKNTRKHLPSEFPAFSVPLTRDKVYTLFRSKFSPIHHYPENHLSTAPYFWEFDSLNYQVLRDGYFTPGISRGRLNRLQKTIGAWKPDILVGDGHLLTYLLGKKMDIPVVQVIRYFAFPENPRFIWWKEPLSEVIRPRSSKVFEDILDASGEPPTADGSHLLRGDGYLIPGNREIEPVTTISPHLFYGYDAGSYYDQRLLFKDPKDHTRKVYVTIGGGAWKSQVKEYYDFLLSIFKQKDFQVIISDPYNILGETLQNSHWPNVRAFRWIESSTVFPNLDLIIHHGGYGTTMESLWWGVPSIVVPFHTEQEGNGRRLQKLGAGEVLCPAAAPLENVSFKYYYGRFTMAGGFHFGLTKERFLSTFEQVMTEPAYKENAGKMSEKLRAAWEPDSLINFLMKF